MAVTKEQILAAADQIAAAGERPTLEAVRQITGGSYTTISPGPERMEGPPGHEAAAPLREPAPQAVADRLAELGADIWGMAFGLANSRLAAEREALEKARAELEADQAEATELADKLAGDVEALQSRLASIEAAEAAARGEADELRGQLPPPRNRRTWPRPAPVEIERRAGELRTELDRAHQDADQVRRQPGRAAEGEPGDGRPARPGARRAGEGAGQGRGGRPGAPGAAPAGSSRRPAPSRATDRHPGRARPGTPRGQQGPRGSRPTRRPTPGAPGANRRDPGTFGTS
jgi:hypothetical protein